MRGATDYIHGDGLDMPVSIHAPHAGRDQRLKLIETLGQCFNPRAPCGARHILDVLANEDEAFQSTRPMRGATCEPICGRGFRLVSIHAPHAGRDAIVLRVNLHVLVSIHAPHAGRD